MQMKQSPFMKGNIKKAGLPIIDSGWARRLRLGLLALGFITTLTLSTSAWAPPSNPRAMQTAQNEDVIPAGAIQARKGTNIKLPRIDDPTQRIQGRVVWFTVDKVGYIDATTDDDAEEVQAQAAWSELDKKRLAPFLSSLADQRDVESLLTVAEIMIDQQVDPRRIEHLFKSALRVDKQSSKRIDALREKLNQAGEPGDENNPANPAEENGEEELGQEIPGAGGQPQVDNPRAWPALTEEQHAAAVKALQASTDQVLEKMGHKMGSTQTERFLVYSDMPAKESKYWVGLLDKMYDKLCGVFALDETENIWKGKCLLLFFNNQQDYLKYNAAAYGNSVSGSAGICYQFGNGDVHIAMYKQQDEKDLAHVLVHEAVHGFLFRYQSSHYVPNWLNEGLAEYIAVSLVNAGGYPGRAKSARQFVKSRNSLDNFLTARNIIGQHYGLAYDVTAMMVSENRKGYVEMIKGIKLGKTAKQAFDDDYGASVDRVFQYYAKTRLKMDGIRVDLAN